MKSWVSLHFTTTAVFSTFYLLLSCCFGEKMDRRKYNVYEGRKPGLYDSWDEAKAQVDGYPRNCHEKVKPSGESFSKPYVVTEGKNPGVYDKWPEAHEQVSGYPGGKVVKAKSFADAETQFQASQGSSKKHGY